MTRFYGAALVVALLLFSTVGMHAASGTLTCTRTDVSAGASASGGFVFSQYTCLWTSTAGGAVSGNNFSIRAGYLESIRFVPGSTTPTDLYDVTLVDSDGTFTSGDLLSGTGADRSATVSSVLTFDPRIFEDGSRTLDIVVANAGNAKTGKVVILVRTR